jgi:hypothetical protein
MFFSGVFMDNIYRVSGTDEHRFGAAAELNQQLRGVQVENVFSTAVTVRLSVMQAAQIFSISPQMAVIMPSKSSAIESMSRQLSCAKQANL